MDRKWLYPGAAAGAIAGIAILASAPLHPTQSSAQATQTDGAAGPTVVEVIAPERRDLVRQTRLPGTIRPWEETPLYAKVSGYLREIRVDKGDLVRRGQLLAVLDIPEMADEMAERVAQERAAQARSREPIVARETARAELDRARCELGGARADLQAARAAAREPESLLVAARAEVAAARTAVQEPKQDVETAQANLRAAQEELQAAEADLDRYQADTTLRERIYQRYKRLMEREVITQQEYDQAEAAYQAARAASSTAKARINAMKERVIAAQSGVRSAEARVTTAEARAMTPEAQIQNVEARVQTARARVAAAEQAVSIAEARVQVARARMQEASAKMASAASDVATAAAGERRVRTLMQYRQLEAPYDGVITARNVDPGQLIQASTSSQAKPMLVVSNVDRLRITIPVPESDVPHLKVGNAVSITVRDLPSRGWTGKITRTTNDLDPVARTMSAEIDLPNSDRRLSPGTYADVVVDLETHPNALVVPSSAVVAEKQKRSLWLVREGKARKEEVTVGVDNGVDAEIRSGLRPTDRVIVSGQSGLQQDQAVKPVTPRTWSAPGVAAGKSH